jgi:hypothetical protein
MPYYKKYLILNLYLNTYLRKLFLIFFFVPACFPHLFAQSVNVQEYQFISPIPGSSLHLPETCIIIRQGDIIDRSTIGNTKLMVIGSRSGIHKGRLILSSDIRTLIYKPFSRFIPGEVVTVNLKNGILTYAGAELPQIEFAFKISELVITDKLGILNPELLPPEKFGNNTITTYQHGEIENINTELPLNFPEFTISISNNPFPGFIFMAPHSWSGKTAYLMIIDNNGVPIYYLRDSSIKYDFKKQDNGLLTYWDQIPKKFLAIDSAYSVIDSFSCGNGYQTDLHELLVFPNGHSFLMSYDPQIVRMDTIVQGGDSAAYVTGLVIQELDDAKNVIFQWRSWDHFQITDATEDIDLTQHSIDYVHGNSIEVDYDGNLVISCRNMDEITKIDRQTGDIIWRFGGLKSKNNQFQFINDTITFSHQHDVRRLPNGNITLFDNGNLHTPSFSRALEYQLDEENKIAVLVWKYNNEPVTFAPFRGSNRRLANHNTLIGWGNHSDPRAVSEVKADGTPVLEILFPDSMVNYRTFKFPWRTDLFVVNPDSIFFESVPVGDSASIVINIVSNSASDITITGFLNRDSIFSVEQSVPFNLPPYAQVPIEVKFKPVEDGFFLNILYIQSFGESKGVAQTMMISGRTDTIFSNVEDDYVFREFVLEQNYPNPFNPNTKIKFTVPTSPLSPSPYQGEGNRERFVTLKVYDVLGNEITTLVNEEKPAGEYEVEFNAANLPSRQGSALTSGIYFYQLRVYPAEGGAGQYVETKKMVLVK